MTEIFDTHAHLLDPVFDADREEILAAAELDGIFVIESALDGREWLAARRLAAKFPRLRYTAGIHPHAAEAAREEEFAALAAAVSDDKCVAVGEAGLDYHYKNSSAVAQKKVFERQMKMALDTGLPLVVHCRDAYADCIGMLSARSSLWRGVVHCFSGSLVDAQKFLSLGFYLGIDGPVTYPKARSLVETVEKVALDRLLTETDSPYLAPQVFRGKRNEPRNVRRIVEKIAEIKKITYEAAAAATSANARALFGIKK